MAHPNIREREAYCRELIKKDFTLQDLKRAASIFNCSIGTLGYTIGWLLSGEMPVYVSKRMRKLILERDNYVCQYCLSIRKKLVPDHVIPYIAGGVALEYNLVACCYQCNSLKKGRVIIPANFSHLEFLNKEWAEKIIMYSKNHSLIRGVRVRAKIRS